MKFIFAVFVTISVICAFASAQQYAQQYPQQYAQQYAQPAPQQIQTNALATQQVNSVLNYIVQSVLATVVNYVVKLVILCAPANAVVDVKTLVTALTALGNPTVNTLLTAVLALVTVDGELILPVFPVGILGLQLDGANLLQFLVASIPPGAAQLPFATVNTLLGNYLLQLLIVLTTQ